MVGIDADGGDGTRTPAVTPRAMIRELAELIDQTRQMLDRASGAGDVVHAVRRASATASVVKDALKSCHLLDWQQFALRQEAAEVHLRTQRRAGQLLLAMARHPGGRPRETPSRETPVSGQPLTLGDLGISPRESHRWQRIARIPGDQFEEHIETCKARRLELTSAGLMALAARDDAARPGRPSEERPEARPARADVRRARHRLWSLVWIDPIHLASALEPGRRGRELERLRELDGWLRAYESSLCP